MDGQSVFAVSEDAGLDIRWPKHVRVTASLTLPCHIEELNLTNPSIPPRWRLMLPLTASITFYPYLKRPIFSKVFIYPQYILGLAVAYPAITGWSSINGQEQSMAEILTHCAPICLLVFFWCFYFNTAYSHQDSVDDQKMNINSAYVVAGRRIRMFLAFLSVLPLAVIPFVVFKINSPWLWFSWMAVWTGAMVKQIAQFDVTKPESGGCIHWENFLLGLWTIAACMVEVGLQKVGFWDRV